MDDLSRGYLSILLEEIALEGLDGITLEVLWIRLENNSDWCLKPIDDNVQEFVWKKLLSLGNIRWYDLKQPRETPPIFRAFEDFYAALENDLIQPVTYSSTCYPHSLVHDGDIIGSCAAYKDRVDVTDKIRKLSLSEVTERYNKRLVIVADQEVRNHFLLVGKVNPEIDIPDISYCILERIGRSRNCGELSIAINFLRNGANPTFYFWNKLRKLGLITAQSLNLSQKLSNATLFYLTKFHKNYTNDVTQSLYAAVNLIQSSPKKFVPLVEVKSLFPSDRRKATKSDVFRRHIKIETIPFKECYPDASEAECLTKNGAVKVIRVAKLVDENVNPQNILRSNADIEEDADKKIVGILQGTRYFNRPLIAQCYNTIHSNGAEGISMVDLGAFLGLNKLVTRLMLKSLKKMDVISSLSFDNGRQRYYRYYSKKFELQVQENLKEQLGKSFTNEEKNSESFASQLCETSDETTLKNETTVQNNISEDAEMNDIENNDCATNSYDTVAIKRKHSEEGEGSPDAKKCKTTSQTSEPLKKETDSKESSPLKTLIPAGESVYFVRRTNIILEYVHKNKVVTASNLLKVIRDEEMKLGVSKGNPCSKSVKRILNMLVESQKVKQFKKLIVEENLKKSREIHFVCSPSVNEDHPIIQTTIANMKKNLGILYLKPSLGGNPKKLSEIKSKLSKQVRSKENDMKYGFVPKFARMRILHEFIINLVYHYEGKEDLDEDENIQFVKNFCSDFDDNEKIPKMYFKEISPKMFVPPLTKYEEYGDGWTSLNDIIERLPLKMLFSLVRFIYHVPSIETYLKHPVKQFYLIRHLPYDLQQVITADKKYISSINSDVKNLCLIGLAQLGPKVNIRGNTNLIYMNKRTELMDTRPCPPTYFRINPNLVYTKYTYDFISNKNTETYWNDAFRFCVGTRLCRKRSASEIRIKERKLKPELLPYVEEHPINDAPKYDNGKLPGDGLGAAGYDSTLYSHFIKQWYLDYSEKVTHTTQPFKPPPKQSRLKSNTQLKRMRLTVQKKRIRKKSSENYDKKDLEALKKMRTLRSQWSKSEDDLLLLCYVASQYHIPAAVCSYMPSALFRKILHENSEISASKTSCSCVRRIKNMMKSPLRQHTTTLFLKDVKHDEELKKRVKGIVDEIDAVNKKDETKYIPLLDKLTEEVFYYLYENSKVKPNLTAKGNFRSKLPKSLEELKKKYNFEYPVNLSRKINYLPLKSENDVIISTLTALIYSALFSQIDKKKSINVNYLYRVFKHFNDEVLKSALTFVRANRLVSVNKYGDRLKSSLLPIGKGTYHFSVTFHTILKASYNLQLFSLIYEKIIEISRKSDSTNFDIDINDVGINLVLIAYLVHDMVDFKIQIPETIMFFNSSPIIEVDPEKTVRRMFDNIQDHVDKTQLLIENSFFKQGTPSKNESLALIQDTKFESTVKRENRDDKIDTDDRDKFDNLSDSDSEDELLMESDDKLEENLGRRSKIAVLLTRRQFKHSYIRFSNAYDHFLFNKFPLSFQLNTEKSSVDILGEGCNFDCCKQIEEDACYTKIKYTLTELTEKVKEKLICSGERDYALHFLEYLHSVGVPGATTEMIANEFKDLPLLKKVTDILRKEKLIIRSGSQYVHYIHINYAQHGLVPCWRNVDAFHEEKNASGDISTAVTAKGIDEKLESTDNKNRMWLAINPWIQINGRINKPALESLLIRVLTHISRNPGISLYHLQRKFEPALIPLWTRQLLEILIELKAVHCSVCHVPKFSLFSKDTLTTISECATGFENEKSIFIEPDTDCLAKLSFFIARPVYEDLLDTKYEYVADMSCAVDQPSEVESKDVSEDSS